jgi:hypothetical protein
LGPKRAKNDQKGRFQRELGPFSRGWVFFLWEKLIFIVLNQIQGKFRVEIMFLSCFS